VTHALAEHHGMQEAQIDAVVGQPLNQPGT
jgi:hypothetical protein